MSNTLRVGIVGASGYTGVELMRLLAGHPRFELVVATGDSQAGNRVSDLYPNLSMAYPHQTFDAYSADLVDGLDVVFIGLPHGVSMGIVPDLVGRVGHIVDLGSDFRLHDAALYPKWYGAEHTAPALLDSSVYGLPELFRSEIEGAELIAATGCNAATATLALAPLVAAGLVEPERLVADIKTGLSGAGRPPKPHTSFTAVDGNTTGYGLLTHRHTPEIEQAIADHADVSPSVLFTPHLVPMSRGILATCYGTVPDDKLERGLTSEDLLGVLADAYADEPFVYVGDSSPQTKSVVGSNAVHLTARFDERTGTALVISVLDNLTKGASGMAVQCANLATGLDETLGLSTIGMYP